MKILLVISALVFGTLGCQSPPRGDLEEPAAAMETRASTTSALAHHRTTRAEPSFAAKRLAAESGALGVAELRFAPGATDLTREELGAPRAAKRADILVWADAGYGEGSKQLANERAKVITEHLSPLPSATYNMTEKAGLVSRALFLRAARVKAAAAAAAPNEASRAIVLFY